MFTVFVTFDVKTDHVREFAKLVTENAATSLAEEGGCFRFDVSEAIGFPGRFYLYEVYVNEAAFSQIHKKSAHFAHFDAQSAGLVLTKEVALANAVTFSQDDV